MKKTAQEAAQTRRLIIRTALHEFATEGWSASSLVSIARDARLSRGAVYHHFANKEALLYAVLSEEWEAQMPPILDTLRSSEAPKDKLLGFLSTYIRLLSEESAFRELAVVSTVVAPQVVALAPGITEKRQALAQWRDLLAPVLAACEPLRRGISVDHALFVIFTFIHGLTLAAATEPDSLPSTEGITATSEAIVFGLLSTMDS